MDVVVGVVTQEGDEPPTISDVVILATPDNEQTMNKLSNLVAEQLQEIPRSMESDIHKWGKKCQRAGRILDLDLHDPDDPSTTFFVRVLRQVAPGHLLRYVAYLAHL